MFQGFSPLTSIRLAAAIAALASLLSTVLLVGVAASTDGDVVEPEPPPAEPVDEAAPQADSAPPDSDPGDEGEAPADPVVEDEAPVDPSDEGEAPVHPSDEAEAPADPVDEAEAPADPSDEGEAPADPVDEAEAPVDPVDEGEAPGDEAEAPAPDPEENSAAAPPTSPEAPAEILANPKPDDSEQLPDPSDTSLKASGDDNLAAVHAVTDHSIGDLVFQDRNRDGIQSGGDLGMPGINSTVTPGGSVATSNGAGAYSHDDLADGNYTVTFDAAQVAALGLEFATPNAGDDEIDSDADLVSGDASTVLGGTSVSNVDAGVRLVAPPAVQCAAGSPLWQNSGDIGLIGDFPGAAWALRLIPSISPALVEETIPIDTSGLVAGAEVVLNSVSWDGYWLRNLTAAQPNEQWRVVFKNGGSVVYESGFTSDLADAVYSAGGSDALGTVVLTDDVDEVVLQHWAVANASTAQNSVVPIALCLDVSLDGSLGDFTWQDRNENGIQDAGDEPLGGVDVALSGDATDAATTGADGLYLFSPLNGGDYNVNFTVPPGLNQTLEDVGDDVLDSDPDPAGDAPVTLPAGFDDLTIDAGYILTPPPAVCPAGTVVYSQTVDTSLIGDVPSPADGVTRLITGSTTEIVVPLTDPVFSDALVVTALHAVAWDGYWNRIGTAQSNEQFRVHFVDSADAILASSVFTDDLADSIYTAAFVGQLANADGVSGNEFSLPTGAAKIVIEHWSVTNASGSADSLVPVALCVETTTGGLEIEKVTEGGSGSFNFTLSRTNAPGDVAGFVLTTTDEGATGAASTGSAFVPTPIGTYTIVEDLIDGWELTGITCDAEVDVDLATGTATVTVAAGNTVHCTFTNNKLEVKTGAIGDFVWDDANVNGIQDVGEAVLPGVKVTLLQGGVEIAVTLTDGAGLYLFDGLAAGQYRVQFETPAGFRGFTLANQTATASSPLFVAAAAIGRAAAQAPSADDGVDSDADVTTGITPVIDLSAGEIDLTIDAGAVRDKALSISILTAVCITDTPYIDLADLTTEGVGAAEFAEAILFVDLYELDASGNRVSSTPRETLSIPLADVADASGQPEFLWPGAELDADGTVVDWPGWDFVKVDADGSIVNDSNGNAQPVPLGSDNGIWAFTDLEGDGWSVDGIEVVARFNPEAAAVVVKYPPPLASCSALPPKVVAKVPPLAFTGASSGPIALFALLLVAAGVGFVLFGRRSARRLSGQLT